MPQGIPITALIAVRNEQANIQRCLTALRPAARVLVIDSHSHDETAVIARSLGAEVVQFDHKGGYPKKRQWVLDHQAIHTPWVFMLDADEVVTPQLWDEIAREIQNPHPSTGYLVTKQFHFLNRKFKHGGFSHAAVLLFQTGKARFERLIDCPAADYDIEVHERLIVEGPIGRLKTPLIHEDFKGLHAYLDRHNRYSTWEAELRYRLFQTGCYGEDTIRARFWGNAQERRRFFKKLAVRMLFEPSLWFLYHYFIRLGFLEGRPGLIASRIRASYIRDVRAKIFELSLNNAQ